MFYETSGPHGLPFNPFKAIVAPRPIGWISSLSRTGVANLAPYSYFNAVHDTPPMVMFSSTGWKDTVANVENEGEFVCNYVSAAMADAMNATSAALPPGASEFDAAGLEQEPSRTVAVPRVRGVPAALECRTLAVHTLETVEGEAVGAHLVVGQVLGVYIDDAFVVDGRFDAAAAAPIMRLGYMDYSHLGPMFAMRRPG